MSLQADSGAFRESGAEEEFLRSACFFGSGDIRFDDEMNLDSIGIGPSKWFDSTTCSANLTT